MLKFVALLFFVGLAFAEDDFKWDTVPGKLISKFFKIQLLNKISELISKFQNNFSCRQCITMYLQTRIESVGMQRTKWYCRVPS